MTTLQSPLVQHPEPYRLSARIDDDDFRVAQDTVDTGYSVNAVERLDGHWAVGLMVNTAGHVKMRLRSMKAGLVQGLTPSDVTEGYFHVSAAQNRFYVSITEPMAEHVVAQSTATNPISTAAWQITLDQGYFKAEALVPLVSGDSIVITPSFGSSLFDLPGNTTVTIDDTNYQTPVYMVPQLEAGAIDGQVNTVSFSVVSTVASVFGATADTTSLDIATILSNTDGEWRVDLSSDDSDIAFPDPAQLVFTNDNKTVPQEVRVRTGNKAGSATISANGYAFLVIESSVKVTTQVEDTVLLPILQGQMYTMNIAEIFAVDTTCEGIHVFGV